MLEEEELVSGAKLGDDVGLSVGIGIRSSVGNGVWAGDGICVRSDVKNSVGVECNIGTGNQTAVVGRGVGGVPITGPDDSNPPATAKRKLLVSSSKRKELLSHWASITSISRIYLIVC